jgi:hypothetical protein
VGVRLSERVADGGGADSIVRFRFEREGDEMKCCRKIKWMSQARLCSMRSKRDTTRWHDDVNRRRGDTGEGIGRRRRQFS